MKTIDEQMTLSEVVTEVPKSGDIFRELRIDYVLNGDRTLGEAARDKNISLAGLIYEIESFGTENNDGIDIKYMDEAGIIQYIQRKYHEDLRDELPVLERYVDKAVKAHQKAHEEYEGVPELYRKLKVSLLDHVDYEDDNVFPMVREFLEHPNENRRESLKPHATSIEKEHAEALQTFTEIRALTNDFTPPADENGELRFILERLEKLERDTMNHLHLENNILLARVKSVEY